MKTSPWQSVRKEELGTIMKTDIMCEIICHESDKKSANSSLDGAFEMFRDFSDRYSRFVDGNELWQLNVSESAVVSEELFDILSEAKRYYDLTEGLFDPCVLPDLERLGYAGAYRAVACHCKEKSLHCCESKQFSFSSVRLDAKTRTITKPRELLIDLGGIGKGYIVDRVTHFLGATFENALVDAGGDIHAIGVNAKEKYPYWAVEAEHPKTREMAALVLLHDKAVATSGRNRRRWLRDDCECHHIIDPRSKGSAADDLLSVTVVAETTTEADVWAKTLFILGKERGESMANEKRIAALFVEKSGEVKYNHCMQPYVWKA